MLEGVKSGTSGFRIEVQASWRSERDLMGFEVKGWCGVLPFAWMDMMYR